MRQIPTEAASVEFEAIIDRFETSWQADQPARIRRFLPEESAEHYGQTLVELIRIDLEFRHNAGHPILVEDYVSEFKREFPNEESVHQLAFEEYRLRHQAGESVSREEYAKRFSVDTEAWPTWSNQSTNTNRAQKHHLPGVGGSVGDFKIVGQLGQGAFGRVYLARQGDLANRLVALKATEYCDVEPENLARLQHTNIIPIFSMHRFRGWQYICMPFLGVVTMADLLSAARSDRESDSSLSGEAFISTVANRRAKTIAESSIDDAKKKLLSDTQPGNTTLKHFKGLSLDQAMLRIFAQIAEGLTHAHSHEIIHGDLKPANILIGDDGNPLLLDFHLSKIVSTDENRETIGGTLPYMSARHLRSLNGSSTVSKQCDIFSFGVMLFETLTGKLPFPVRGCDEASVQQMIEDRMQDPPDVRSIDRAIPPGIASIVDNCITDDENQRYQSASHLHEDLQMHLDNMPLKYAENRSTTELIQKWGRRHPRISSAGSILTIASTIIALLIVAVVLSMNRASKLSARADSQDFVQTIRQLRLPLTFAPSQSPTFADAMDRAEEAIQSRTDGNLTRYQTTLTKLNPEQRDKEIKELLYLQYYLAAANYVMARSTTDAEARRELLYDASQEIQRAETLAAPLQPPSLRLLHADIQAALGNLEFSEELRRLASENPESSIHSDLLLQYAELRRKGNFAEAIEVLQELTGKEPANFFSWLALANTYSALGNYDKADACYSICLALNEQSDLAYFHRGSARLSAGNIDGAILDFEEANVLAPGDPVTLLNWGLALRSNGQLEMAEEKISEAIELGAPQTRAYYLRHKIRKQTGNDSGAAEDLEVFLTKPPTEPVSWNSRGLAQMIAGNDPKIALEDFQAGLNLDPNSVEILNNIATVQAEYLDDLESAIRSFDRIIDLSPSDPVALATRGVLLARAGSREKALADAKAALGLRQDADVLYRVAGIYALNSKDTPGDAKMAFRLLGVAIKRNPKRVDSDIHDDADLDPIRGSEDFQRLLEVLKSVNSL